MPNTLDLIVLTILALCVWIGYRRGLILTLFRLVSFFMAFFFTMKLYPHMSRLLLQTPLYGHLQEMVINSMGLKNFIQEHATLQAAELIKDLPLPAVLMDLVIANNTPDMYDLLNVRNVEEYIGGFFANMAVNGIAMMIVFVLVGIALSIAGGMLNVISHLPVINTLNRIGGVAVGFIIGMAVVWIGLTVMGLLFFTPANPQLYDLLQTSLVTRWMFDNNWMIGLIVQ